jgi:GNAT superfamily N-acetyltransferase
MEIREAVPEDSEELKRLQEKAPQGKSLIVSTVNIPDFFSRVSAYQSWKVFNAYEDGRIIGSAACATRDGIVGTGFARVGYEFQYFTSPEFRRRSVASKLHQTIEGYLKKTGAALSYALIMEGNTPSMRLFENEGFHLHRKLVMPGLTVFRKLEIPGHGNIRPSEPRDLDAVVELINQTWGGYQLFEPTSAASLADQIERIANIDYNDLLLLEDENKILACAALWDWSKIMRITVLRLNLKMRLLGKFLVLTRILPRFPSPGDTFNQMMLTMIGYRTPPDLSVLIKHANNLALEKGIEQIFCICEQKDKLIESMKGFDKVNTGINLYVKIFKPDVMLADFPIAMTGLDM